MTKCLKALVLSALVVGVAAQSAYALPDPCRVQSRELSRTERRVEISQRRVAQAENRLARLQDQITYRQYAYQNQIAVAQAHESAVAAAADGRTASCVINSFFGYGSGRCFYGSIASSIRAQANARARVNIAISRANAYYRFAQGALYREGQRIVMVQSQYTFETTQYEAAQTAYSQCLAAHSG